MDAGITVFGTCKFTSTEDHPSVSLRGFRKIVAGKCATSKELLAVAPGAFLVQYDRSKRDLGLRERFSNTPNNVVVVFCSPDTPGLPFLRGVQIDTDFLYNSLWGTGSGGQLILVGDISDDLKLKIGKDTSVTHVADCTGDVLLSWLGRAVDEANQGRKRVTVFFFGHGERVVGPDRYRTEDGFVNENRIAEALSLLNRSADFWFWVDACYAWSLVNTVVASLDKTRPRSGYKSGLARVGTLFSEMDGLSPYAYNAFNEREERAIAKPCVIGKTFDMSQIQEAIEGRLSRLDEVRTIMDKGAKALRDSEDENAAKFRKFEDESARTIRKLEDDSARAIRKLENENHEALKTAKEAAKLELNAAEARAEAAERKLKDAEARAEAAEKKLKEAEAEAKAAYSLAEKMTKEIQTLRLPAPA